MEVFEARHELGLGLKTPDEIRMIGEVRQDDFDGDFASDSGLVGFVDRAEATRTNPFAQFVAFNSQSTQVFHRLPTSMFQSSAICARWCQYSSHLARPPPFPYPLY